MLSKKTLSKASSKTLTENSTFSKAHDRCRVIWITPFKLLTGRVKILDLTPAHLPLGQSEDQDFQIVKQYAESLPDSGITPAWTFRRTGYYKDIVIYEGDPPSDKQQGIVAVWDPARWEYGINIINFPASGFEKRERYPSHEITMRRSSNPCKRMEMFVSDSFTYIWRWDNLWTCRLVSLFKVVNGVEVQVARYKGKYPFVKAAGMLLIDENEVDAFLAVITCFAVLRKDLQKRK